MLKILAQNALDAFSDPKTTDEYVALIEHLQPDVAIFPEAYDADRTETVVVAIQQLKSLGYEVLHGLYDDKDGRKDRHGTILLVRQGLQAADKPSGLLWIGLRNAIQAWVVDPDTQHTVHVVGVHLNDRSEAKRQAELDDLLGKIIKPDEPTIIAGDLNAIYRQDAKGFVVSAARFINLLVRAHLFPAPEPVVATHSKKNLGRVGSLSKRMSEIASGKTLARLQAAGLTDADPTHMRTYPAARPVVQLDHIMLSPSLSVRSFEVLPKTSSDHLGIMADAILN